MTTREMYTFWVSVWLFAHPELKQGVKKDICCVRALACKMNNVLNGSSLAFSCIGSQFLAGGKCLLWSIYFLNTMLEEFWTVSKLTSWSFPWYPAAHVPQENQGGGLVHTCIPGREDMAGRTVHAVSQN